MTNPAFKDPWPKDWRELADQIEEFQDDERRRINLERDRKSFLDTIDHLIEAGDEMWLVDHITELYFRLVRK